MKIVMWGTYDVGKPRVRILERGLRENGVNILTCHRDVWAGIEDKSQITGILKKTLLFLNWLLAYPSLIYRYLRLPKHDVVLVAYMGHLDVLVIWPFARLRGVPIVWDAFLSLYSTIVEDRRLLHPRNPLAKLIWCWEWLACRAADIVMLDTRAHADYFVETFNVPVEKTAVAFVGVEPEIFPSQSDNYTYDGAPIVLFYGQFIPLHGIETIIKSAQLSCDEYIEWVVIGSGQEASNVRKLIDEMPLQRLRWIPWVSYSELTDWIARSSVCLGIFGDSDKASRVIPNKVFQILMSGKPLVTRDSPAIKELISSETKGVYLVPPVDPEALLEAVRIALSVPAMSGLHSEISSRITPRAVGSSLLKVIFRER